MTHRWISSLTLGVALALVGCQGGDRSSAPTTDSADTESTRTVFTCASDSGGSITVDGPNLSETLTIDRDGVVEEFPVDGDQDLEIATDITFSQLILASKDKIGQLIVGRLLIGNAGANGRSPAHIVMTTIDDLTAPATLTTEVFACVQRPASGEGEACGGSGQEARVCLPGLECHKSNTGCLACKGTCE